MLGCDIVEIDRIDKLIKRYGDSFAKKILSEKEIIIYNKRSNKKEFLAGRFAAKESISKSIGTGFDEKLWFTDIEILPNNAGKPIVYIKGDLQIGLEVSISHSRHNAIAVSMTTMEAK